MSSSADASEARFDGLDAVEVAALLRLPRVELFDTATSTLDIANAIGPSAPAGTLVLADEQTAGRGRQGRAWTSARGAGLWLTLVERPEDPLALEVMSLRCGLYAAEALDALAGAPIGVKWPNDLYVRGRKLAGILIETRWRGTAPEWVSIGFGLNVAQPQIDTATGLAPGTARRDALIRLIPALRRAALATGQLTNEELTRWSARDVARGRRIEAPSAGTVAGISARGELLVRGSDGTETAHRSGTLTFAEPLACS
ncbi:MAG: biotin--[acetyl-CoA-carboxylase] ligase [Gemmatimonadetes bacterium]|nr:biotin--[acetyl-CoA-carboxylase] ligase [Gemmatimonadota bacterium]